MLNVKGLVECVYSQEDVFYEMCNWAVENNLVGKNIIDILSIEEIEELANELVSDIGRIIVDFSLNEGPCIKHCYIDIYNLSICR